MKRLGRAGILLSVLIGLLVFSFASLVQADFGTNWTATFFPQKDLTGTCTGTCSVAGVGGLNFSWGAGAPSVNGITMLNGQTDNFSARFTSTQALAVGTYNFVVTADDGVRVYINGQLRLNQWQDQAVTTYNFTETVTTSPVNITVEYYEGIDQAQLKVEWFMLGAGTTTAVFTPVGTYVAPATAVPPLTVQVKQVRGLSIRTGPYLGASYVGAIVPGTSYAPKARNNDESGINWYLITAGDKTGWVSGRYLEITGDPNSVPAQGTIFDQIDNASAVGAFASPRSVMNLRRRPSVRTTSLMEVPWGAQMELIGRTIQGGKNYWLQVRYEGKVGWLLAAYVAVSGNIDAVPIR